MPTLRLAGAVAAALLLVPAAAQANFPGANGRIAFNWTFGCDGSVIADMRPDGSGRRLLTAERLPGRRRAARRVPRLLGRRRTIAFVRGGRLITMTAGGANETPVPGIAPVARAGPTLSPDGERVAYTRVVDGRHDDLPRQPRRHRRAAPARRLAPALVAGRAQHGLHHADGRIATMRVAPARSSTAT